MNVSRCCQMSPGAPNHPWLRTTLPRLARRTVTGMQVSELGRVQGTQTSSSPWQTKPPSFTERFPSSFSLTDPLCCTLYLKGNTLAFQNHFQFLKLSAVACLQAIPILYFPWSTFFFFFVSYMIFYMFQCHSPKSSHPLPLPQSP